jgi:hypothetical protein
MDLLLSNARDERTSVSILLLRPTAAEYSEAVTYDERFELPPITSEKPVPNVAPDRPYLVRMETDFGLYDHYHYNPDCRGADAPDPGLSVTVTTANSLRVAQSTCSSNEWFL